MRSFLWATVVLFFSGLVSAEIANVSKSGLALEGFDPVSYFRVEAIKQGPLKGDAKHAVKVDGVTYHFSSEANKAEFEKNPSKYAPAFGGWCAYAIAEKKEKVEVDVKSFLIQDGRLLLFYKSFLADTRDRWSHSKEKTAQVYLAEADKNWPAIKDRKP